MSKDKPAKYKITDTDISRDIVKKIVGRQVTVEKVKSKGIPSNDRTPPKKQKSTRDLLIEFMNKQDKFNKSLINRIDRIVKVNNLKD